MSDTETLPETERAAMLRVEDYLDAGLTATGLDPTTAPATRADHADAVLDAAVLDPDAAHDGGWTVDSLSRAAHALRRMTQLQAALDDVDATYQARYGPLKAWRDAAARPLQGSLDWYRTQLERYAMARRRADPAAKTLNLPEGTVSTRPGAARVVLAPDTADRDVAAELRPLVVRERMLDVWDATVSTTVVTKVYAAGLKAMLDQGLVELRDDGRVVWVHGDEAGTVLTTLQAQPATMTATVKPARHG